MGTYRQTDDSNDSSTCNIADTSLQHYLWQCEYVVAACESGAAGRPRFIYVPSKHKSNDKSSGLPPSGWWVYYFPQTSSLAENSFASHLWIVPPNILDIESTPSSVAVRENQNINMTCKADGFPAPKIIWRREDGLDIVVDKKKSDKGKSMFVVRI